MTPKEYESERKRRGSRKDVADKLGISVSILSLRERGLSPINREAELSLLALPLKPNV